MEPKKKYRNSIRSHKLIRQAFMELLHEKPFEKITATDIINRADINRSTFYAHYPDVKGIIDEIQNQIMEHSKNIWCNQDFSNFFQDPTPFLQNAVKLLHDNQELYTLLGKSTVATQLLEEMKKMFIETILNAPELPTELRSSPVFSIYIRFFSCGLIDVFCQWVNEELDCDMDLLIDELANLLKNLYKSEFFNTYFD